MIRRRPGLVIVALAAVVAVVVIVAGIRKTPSPTPTQPRPAGPTQRPGGEQATAQPISLHIDGTEITQRDEQGKTIWQMRAAGRLDFDEATETLRAENIRWELDRAGQEKLIVEASQFAARYKEKRIDFAEGVRVYTESKSQVFEVSSLTYELDTQKLIGHGPVTFRVGRYQASGKRLVIDNQGEEVRLTGPGRFSRLPGS